MKKYMNIEAERARMGMSKREMAETLNISLKTYYNWIMGVTAIPSTSLVQMSKIFQVDIDYLLSNSDLSKPHNLITH